MREPLRSNKILTSKQAIIDYISEDCTDYMFQKYVKAGMLARFEDGRWLAHADNIDEFFKIYTRVQMKTMPEEETKKSK